MNIETQLRILAAIDACAGVLTPAKAEAYGISRQLLADARNAGIIERPRRGVYVRPGTVGASLRVASAGLGSPAALSHCAAGVAYAYDGVPDHGLQWSVPHTRRPTTPGVFMRRRYDELDLVERDGVLMTSPLQTLADLGYLLDADRVERAMESGLRRELFTEAELRAFAAQISRRPGAPTLRAVVARRPPGAPPTESDAETICLQVFRRGGVPQPTRQFSIYDGAVFVARVDFHWTPTPFGVEVDGLETHSSPQALQWDLNRGNRIADRSHHIRRFTYWDVTTREKYVCRETMRGLAIAESMATKSQRKRRNAG